MNTLKSKIIRLTLIAVVILAGIVTILWVVDNTVQEMKSSLLKTATIAASSLNFDELDELTGTASDTLLASYVSLKKQLINMRTSTNVCKYLYLMRQKKNGQVIFLCDAQFKNSPDYAVPGLVYNEISDEYLNVFKTNIPSTVGPISDRWGTLVTTLIPIIDKQTKRQIAVLGMDLTVNNWHKHIFKNVIPIILILIISTILIFYIQQFRLLKETRKSQEFITEINLKYQSLFEQAPDGIIIGDLNGNLKKVNSSFCQMTGYSEEELLSQNISILFKKEVLTNKPLNYDDVYAGKLVKSTRNLKQKNGNEIVVEMYSKRLGDNLLQSFLRDVTDRINTQNLLTRKNVELSMIQEELESSNEELSKINEILQKQKKDLIKAKKAAVESDKLKSIFLANMSHEIRTPMNAIIGFSELIIETMDVSGNLKEYVTNIFNQGQHLMSIISDIIDISKIETNQLSITESTYNVEEVFAEIYKTWNNSNRKKKDVKFIVDYPEKENKCLIYTDIVRFKQILNNLVSNAFKFTHKGYVKLSYRCVDGKVVFTVEDTGIGIPMNRQDDIFGRFFRIQDKNSNQYEGTGLGLAITKDLVELLNGTITVESETSKGSTFILTLPQPKHYKSAKIEKKQQSNNVSQYNWSGKTIMIVEDDSNSVKLLVQILKNTGAVLKHFGTVKDTLNALDGGIKPDAILLDIKLPDDSGLKVVKTLRAKSINTPVIAQTAFAFGDNKLEYMDAGCTDYLSKPINAKELLNKLSKYL